METKKICLKKIEFNNNLYFEKQSNESTLVTFCCDTNYLKFMFTTLYSLLDNTNGIIEIILLTKDFDEKKFLFFLNRMFKKNKNFANRLFVNIVMINETKDTEYLFKDKYYSLNFNVFSRLLLLEEFFSKCDFIAYIDSDILIRGDIIKKVNEFINSNESKIFVVKDYALHVDYHLDFLKTFNTQIYSVCKNIFEKFDNTNINYYQYIKKILKIEPKDYFNAGVFFLKRNKIDSKKIKISLKNRYILMDQDLLNTLFKNEKYFLPVYFNYPIGYVDIYKNNNKNIFQKIAIEENDDMQTFIRSFDSVYEKSLLLHFCGGCPKPWNIWCNWTWWKKEYFEYYKIFFNPLKYCFYIKPLNKYLFLKKLGYKILKIWKKIKHLFKK